MHKDADKAPSAPAREPASRAELDRLEALRQAPRRDLVLAPGLGGSRAVEAEEAHRRSARVAELRARLDAASGWAREDFTRGKARGRARSAFDRSR